MNRDDITPPIEQIMRTAPVIPVLVIEDARQARPLAEALVRGGLPVLEVTLRTAAALEVIGEMRRVEGAIVGAGTVINTAQLEQVRRAGVEFVVSPGLTWPLGEAAAEMGVPFLPGVATAGDIMRGLDLGLSHFKFFPAMAAGGTPALKALAAPFSQALFCPTGGITAQTAVEWLALEPVLCVGGSWIVPPGASVTEVEALAVQAQPSRRLERPRRPAICQLTASSSSASGGESAAPAGAIASNGSGSPRRRQALPA